MIESNSKKKPVSRWVKRFEEDGSLKSRVRSGMPTLITRTKLIFMVEDYEANWRTFKRHNKSATMVGTSFATIVPAAYVLHDDKPENVARSMIEYGHQQQSFFIFNMDEAYQRIQHFKTKMPRMHVYYAMKCNDTEMMLKLVMASGLGFDCGSPHEIYRLRQLNVSPENMIYSMLTKTPEHMIYAKKTGIQLTTFDNSYELKKLKENWSDVRLLLQVRVDSDKNNTKFANILGCSFEYEAVDLLEEAANLGLQVVGVAFHVDPECPTDSSYLDGLKYAKALFDHEAKAGRKMTIVDIGGGFASDRTDRIDKVSKLINSAVEDMFPDPEVQIFGKPGRYICGSSFTLYCSINDIRRVKRGDKILNMAYINDGIYGTLRYSDSLHNLSKFKATDTLNSTDLEELILWGPTCDSYDRVMSESTVLLPRCEPRDWLVFKNHGANTITFTTRFSSLQIPLIRPVVSSDLWKKLKNTDGFAPKDFILYPDVSVALPIAISPLPIKNDTYQQPKTHILTI